MSSTIWIRTPHAHQMAGIHTSRTMTSFPSYDSTDTYDNDGSSTKTTEIVAPSLGPPIPCRHRTSSMAPCCRPKNIPIFVLFQSYTAQRLLQLEPRLQLERPPLPSLLQLLQLLLNVKVHSRFKKSF